MKKKTLYQILGVKKDATPKEILKAYRAKCLKYHPDRNIGNDAVYLKLREVQEAYDILKDKESRKHYDETGEAKVIHKENAAEEAHFHGFLTETFREVVTEMISQRRNPRLTNPLEIMRNKWLESTQVKRERIHTLKEAMLNMEEIRKRLKGDKSDFLLEMIDSEIKDFEDKIKDNEKNIEIDKKLLEYVKRFKYETDNPQWNMPSYGMMTMRDLVGRRIEEIEEQTVRMLNAPDPYEEDM